MIFPYFCDHIPIGLFFHDLDKQSLDCRLFFSSFPLEQYRLYCDCFFLILFFGLIGDVFRLRFFSLLFFILRWGLFQSRSSHFSLFSVVRFFLFYLGINNMMSAIFLCRALLLEVFHFNYFMYFF